MLVAYLEVWLWFKTFNKHSLKSSAANFI